LLLATAALFLIANRASYKGYFQDDELNNISWTRDMPALEYGKAVLTPRFFTNNFRPVGHYYYREMSLRYGRLFDTTVRAEYERALDLAKQQATTTPASGRRSRRSFRPGWPTCRPWARSRR